MFMLRVSYHVRDEEYIFDTQEAAMRELDALQGKIGQKWYGKNDGEQPVYLLKTAISDVVICLEKIESVAVFDLDIDIKYSDIMFERKMNAYIRHKKMRDDAGIRDKL